MLLMTFVLHVARAGANVLASGRWGWPPRTELFSSVPGLLRGDASAGLAGRLSQPATETQLGMWIFVFEVATLTSAALVLRWGTRRWGPGRILGMASPNEVERVLGASRLRRNAAVIRPDLYGRGARS